MNEYLTIQQAVELTGKSLPTITRLARKHKDTSYVKMQGKKYLIAIDLISQYYNIDYSDNSHTNSQIFNQEESIKDDMIRFLKSEIQEKNRHINDLTERLREHSIMLQSFQSKQLQAENSSSYNSSLDTSKILGIIKSLYHEGYSSRYITDYMNDNNYLNRFNEPFTVNAIQKKIQRMKRKGIL